MLSPHDFFFGVIGDVVERAGRAVRPGAKCGAWHWRTITASSHTTWGHLRLIITTSGGRRMPYTVMALKDCHRREVNLRIRPNLCSRGIHGVCVYIRVDTKTQQKEWHPSTSVICQTRPLKLILVSVSMMAMGSKWRTNEHPLHSPRTFSTPQIKVS